MNKIPSNALFAIAQVPAERQIESPTQVVPTPEVTQQENNPTPEERTQEVAQTALKGYGCWNKFREQIKNIVSWIKNIPSRLRFIPREIAKALNHLISSKDDDELEDAFSDDEEDFQEVYMQNATAQKSQQVSEEDILKFKQNLNIEYLKVYFKNWNSSANKLANSVSLIKVKFISDLDNIKKYTSDINENLVKISKFISILGESEVADEVKEYANAQLTTLSDKYNTAQKDLKARLAAKQKKIRDLEIAEKNKDKAPAISKTKVPQAFIDDVRNRGTANALDVPPDFKNKDNSCWFDASCEIFWTMGEFFHQMVEEKWQQREQVIAAYNREIESYNSRKQAWDQKMVQYHNDYKKAEAWKKANDQYEKEMERIEKQEKKAVAEFEAKVEAYNTQFKKYVAKKTAWENSGKTTEEPHPPEEPKKLPEIKKPEEPPLILAPNKPPKPSHPFNYPELLNALRQFSQAIKIGKNIHAAAANLRKVIEKDGLFGFTHGRQEDAHEFINNVVSFLRQSADGQANGLFELVTQAKGKEGTAFEGLTRTDMPEPHNALELDFKDNITNFQELLDANFKEEDTDPEESEDLYNLQDDPTRKHPIPANFIVKKNRILNPENPPDFFLVLMKRFYTQTGKQVARERAAITNQRQELIKKRADELLAKDPETYKTSSQKIAEEQLRKEKKLPEYPVNNGGIRKNMTQLRFPENQRISFAKPYEEESSNPDFEYELSGVVIHRGELGYGHYVANVKSSDQTKWYHVNDTEGVKQSSLKIPEETGNGYVYFFRRVKRNAPTSSG